MNNFAVSDREGRQAIRRRGRENPISLLVLTKHSGGVKNILFTDKSFILHSLTTEEESKEENKIHFSKIKKEPQEM